MRLSDEITAYILHMLEQTQNGCAVLQRNELAEEIGCVPSQINYVLTSRFTPEQVTLWKADGAAADTFGSVEFNTGRRCLP